MSNQFCKVSVQKRDSIRRRWDRSEGYYVIPVLMKYNHDSSDCILYPCVIIVNDDTWCGRWVDHRVSVIDSLWANCWNVTIIIIHANLPVHPWPYANHYYYFTVPTWKRTSRSKYNKDTWKISPKIHEKIQKIRFCQILLFTLPKPVNCYCHC